MKIALSWLREYCNWQWTEDELIEVLTMSGTEVEAVHRTGCSVQGVVTARVLSFEKHPNADRLRLCQVDDGSGQPRQIVCGASNFSEGDIVPLALPGTTMPSGMVIKDSKLRGERSSGMMCAAPEIGVQGEDKGLLILPQQTPVGKPISEVLKGDTVLELEVTPNRADLLSYVGVARELCALGAENTAPTLPEPCKACGAEDAGWRVSSEDTSGCPRYTGRLYENVRVGASPDWLKQRLEAVGLRSINNVVDITNYVLLELGQPLHSFDADILEGRQLTARRARDGEKFLALNEKEYELQPVDLVIADGRGPVALAGVMGGESSGVTERSTRVFLESAVFSAADVRATSRRLGLISDSSYRFERGVDPRMVDAALARAGTLLEELCGARPASAVLETAAVVVPQCRVTLRGHAVQRVLGIAVSDERIRGILSSLGCNAAGDGQWDIPSHRPDLSREIDLVEEVARIVGLADIPGRLPAGVDPRSRADIAYDAENKLRQLLNGLGYAEMLTSSLVPREADANDRVSILLPLNEENVHLRKSLLETILPCVARNLAHGAETVKGFEIGTVYKRQGGTAQECRNLVLVLTGMEQADHWTAPGRKADYFTLKGVLEALAEAMPQLKLPEQLGRVDAALLKAHGVKVPVFAAELTLPEWVDAAPLRFQTISSHPAVRRDLCFVVPRQVPQAAVLAAVTKAAPTELQDVECFDRFVDPAGVKLSAEEKALAYALTYRSPERTLTEKEVAGWDQAIIHSVEQATGGRLR